MANQYEKRKSKTNKTVPLSEAVVEKTGDVVIPVYDRTGHDVYFDDAKRKFIRVDIEYDSTTGSARVKNTVELADSQPVATYKMQELLARKILGIK